MDKVERAIRALRDTTIANCKERIDAAALMRDRKQKPQRGVTAILKNKYFATVLMIMCICISPSLAAGVTQNNTIVTTSSVIVLQGGGEYPPIAYLGEYVDLASVVGWTGQLGYWYGDPISGSRPDIIVDASSFQHRFWLDPAKFRVGYWYKWDGSWESAGNMDAFEIRAGIRPAAVDTLITKIPTPEITPLTTPLPEERAPVHILIARGDEVTYYYKGVPEDNTQAHIWLGGQKDAILGDDMEVTKDVASYAFREQVSEDLRPGWYYGYIQFSKGRPDVWYNASHKIGDDYTKILETPYDDVIIPDIDVAPYVPEHILADFEKLESNKEYCSDTLVKITMEVIDPIVRFTDYYEEDDSIVIKGNSTVSEGTKLSFVIDPDDQIGGYTLNSHTFTTTLVGGIDNERRFSIDIPLKWDELHLGEHIVVATLDRLKIHLTLSKEFEVKSAWVNPTPAGYEEKSIVSDGGWHRVNATPEPTKTPQIIYVTQPPQIVYVYVTTTATPKPTPTPTPTESPIGEFVAVVALVGVAYAVMRKR